MPRITDGPTLAALAAGDVQPALFVQLTFSTATVYIWSGVGNLSWNGQTWIGLGSLLGITDVGDGSSVEARGVAFTLSACDPTALADALGEVKLGLPAILYLGLYVSSSLLSAPIVAWSGRMDQPARRRPAGQSEQRDRGHVERPARQGRRRGHQG